MRSDKVRNDLDAKLAENPFILCICEGSAEAAVIKMLLDRNMLKFTKEDLVDGEVTKIRKAREIEKEFLNRVLSSRESSAVMESNSRAKTLSKIFMRIRINWFDQSWNMIGDVDKKQN